MGRRECRRYKIKFKNKSRLGGIHTALICYCENDACSAYQIVWISEDFEIPLVNTAIKQLYEIGWDWVERQDVEYVLCSACVTLYRQEQETDAEKISAFQTVELGQLVRKEVQEDVKDTDSQ